MKTREEVEKFAAEFVRFHTTDMPLERWKKNHLRDRLIGRLLAWLEIEE